MEIPLKPAPSQRLDIGTIEELNPFISLDYLYSGNKRSNTILKIRINRFETWLSMAKKELEMYFEKLDITEPVKERAMEDLKLNSVNFIGNMAPQLTALGIILFNSEEEGITLNRDEITKKTGFIHEEVFSKSIEDYKRLRKDFSKFDVETALKSYLMQLSDDDRSKLRKMNVNLYKTVYSTEEDDTGILTKLLDLIENLNMIVDRQTDKRMNVVYRVNIESYFEKCLNELKIDTSNVSPIIPDNLKRYLTEINKPEVISIVKKPKTVRRPPRISSKPLDPKLVECAITLPKKIYDSFAEIYGIDSDSFEKVYKSRMKDFIGNYKTKQRLLEEHLFFEMVKIFMDSDNKRITSEQISENVIPISGFQYTVKKVNKTIRPLLEIGLVIQTKDGYERNAGFLSYI